MALPMSDVRVDPDSDQSNALSAEDCFRLLAGATTGRVALTVHALPTIVPLNYVLTEAGIVISTTRDSWVHAATDDAVVAFEADGADPSDGSQWYVVVVGVASELPGPDPPHRPDGLADPSEDRLVLISWGTVTGRTRTDRRARRGRSA